MHLGCAVGKRVSSRSFEVVCFGMPRGLCREWGDGQKGAAARVVNDSIPALMAASCGRSITQFTMASFNATRRTVGSRVRTWLCLTGMFRWVLMAVSINRAGSIKCPFAPSIISLAPRRLLVYSQQHAPGLPFLQTLSGCVVHILELLTSSPRTTATPSLCKTVHCRHVLCLINGLLLSDLRSTSKSIGLVLGAVCPPILLLASNLASCQLQHIPQHSTRSDRMS